MRERAVGNPGGQKNTRTERLVSGWCSAEVIDLRSSIPELIEYASSEEPHGNKNDNRDQNDDNNVLSQALALLILPQTNQRI